MFSMKHLLMGVYRVCANKSPWVKLALQRWGGGWGAFYTGERPQGHHGPLVYMIYIISATNADVLEILLFTLQMITAGL
jgi:hypothetical protein